MQCDSWAAGLELVGDDERCLALTGQLPLRLLAERAGLRVGITAAMHRPGYAPDYDRRWRRTGDVLAVASAPQIERRER